MIKSFLFLFSALCTGFLFSATSLISKPLNAYEQRIEDIKNATVLLIVNGKRGTGTLINFQKKKYILTNAHVCIDNFQQYMHHEGYAKNYLNLKTDISVYGKNESPINLKINNSTSVEFSLYDDFCVLEVDPKKFPKNLYSFIYLAASKEVLNIAEKQNQEKKDELLLFTRNYTKDSDVFIKKGKRAGVISEEFEIRISGMKKDEPNNTYWRGPAGVSTIDVIPGDSGSAIYDYKLNMVGLAFGTRFDHEKYDIDDLETFLAVKNIKKHSISKLKNGIKEIQGLYINVDYNFKEDEDVENKKDKSN